MFGIILSTYLCSMFGNKFEMEGMWQAQDILLWIPILFGHWKSQIFSGLDKILLFRKWFITFSLIQIIILFSYILYAIISHPGNGQLVHLRCTPSVYYRKSIWPVLADQLTCINKHVAGTVTKFNASLYFYFNFGCKSENVICCGNEYG